MWCRLLLRHLSRISGFIICYVRFSCFSWPQEHNRHRRRVEIRRAKYVKSQRRKQGRQVIGECAVGELNREAFLGPRLVGLFMFTCQLRGLDERRTTPRHSVHTCGEGRGGVKWLQQLLVKDLSQSVSSAPLVSAVTGEGVTQTCLFLPTAVITESVCCKWYEAALACCAAAKSQSLFPVNNDFNGTVERTLPIKIQPRSAKWGLYPFTHLSEWTSTSVARLQNSLLLKIRFCCFLSDLCFALH